MDITEVKTLGRRRVLARMSLPTREETLAAPPAELMRGPSANLLTQHNEEGRVWQHQAMALESLTRGENPVIATGTSSGKSLIFQTWAFDRLARNPHSTIAVFDPLRALATDQAESWKEQAEVAGFNPEVVVKIDGSVPMAERERLIRDSSIVIMTPDICHAWLMRKISLRAVSEFIGNLSLIVIDEAHVYDSVFGSNTAYLFRRLLNARGLTSKAGPDDYRVIAATATISNPAEHLAKLTGLPFTEITEEHNGARVYPRTLLHIEGDNETDLLPVLREATGLADSKFIAFMDSRQGVERLARQIPGNTVMAYRNGYEASDRREVELSLRNNRLKGVVSTSALELGINIPGLNLGINLKVPDSRKSFRQRLGRVGRDGPGLFVIVAPENAFAQYGETMESYYESSVEPTLLYLENEYIQFANAQCMATETGAYLPSTEQTLWPSGFRRTLDSVMQRNWAERYDAIAQAGRRNPHIAHALRNVGEAEMELVNRDNLDRTTGTINLSKAIRETYPMAGYLHRGVSYQVQPWETDGQFGKTIIPICETPFYQRTRPDIVATLEVKGIVGKNIVMHRETEKGYVAEVYATVTETVVGYQGPDGRSVLYPSDERPTREFDTTGVLLRIREPWHCWAVPRQQLGMTLKSYLCHYHSIAPWDVSYTDEPATIASREQPDGVVAQDATVVYDNIHGSLRLTSNLFDNLASHVERLQRSIDLDGEPINQVLIKQLAEWCAGLNNV